METESPKSRLDARHLHPNLPSTLMWTSGEILPLAKRVGQGKQYWMSRMALA